jgi:hypothetical protein
MLAVQVSLSIRVLKGSNNANVPYCMAIEVYLPVEHVKNVFPIPHSTVFPKNRRYFYNRECTSPN